MNNITVILNCYKRPEYLQEQIEAIKSQSIPPEDIMIWYNKPEDKEQYDLTNLGCKVATCNYNFKFHGRFAFGLLAKTKYVAFFDDDTIPGNKWFENCLNTINNGYDGILGASGVLLYGNGYDPHEKIGWNGRRSTNVTEVDLVGHAWFMKRDYLKYLWYDYPLSWENGEDIQLSYLAQKYGGIKTYVPPHPINDESIWGSNPITGFKYGGDENSSFKTNKTHGPIRNSLVTELIEKGWKTVVKNR